jgi:GNAT superfamily N-acetyltransferase
MIQIEQVPLVQVWKIRHEVMWPGHPFDFVKVPDDLDGEHWGLLVHDELVSVVSIFEKGEEAQFRKFATLEKEQGKGYGSELLAFVLENLRQKGTKRIWCNARAEKAGFYRRFGLVETSVGFEKEGIAYVMMEIIH